jgi:hypothetical protein
MAESRGACTSANPTTGAPDVPLVIESLHYATLRYPVFHPEPIARGSHIGLPKRRRTDRRRHLTLEQVRNLTNAVMFTRQSGAPLTVFLTIVWGHCPTFTERNLGTITTALFDCIGKWLRRHKHGNPLRAVWTREHGRRKGHHLHALANIPVKLLPELELQLQRSFGFSAGGLKFTLGRFGMRSPRMQMGALRYSCKSLDHRAFLYEAFESVNIADRLGIEHVGTDGIVRAKRAGWTQNIGPTARRRAGWRELRHHDELAFALNPGDHDDAG